MEGSDGSGGGVGGDFFVSGFQLQLDLGIKTESRGSVRSSVENLDWNDYVSEEPSSSPS